MEKVLARLQGFEPRTHGLEGRCSLQLSYKRMHRRTMFIICMQRPFVNSFWEIFYSFFSISRISGSLPGAKRSFMHEGALPRG